MGPKLVAAAPRTVTERSVNTPAYTQSAPTVRPFAAAEALPSPRAVDEFMAERVELTAAEALDPTLLKTLQNDFLRLVETEADGATQILATPDGRKLEIRIERSTTREASKPTVRPINYTGQAAGFSAVPRIRASRPRAGSSAVAALCAEDASRSRAHSWCSI